MRIFIAAVAILVAAPAFSQTAGSAAKRGDVVFDAGKHRVGTIARIEKDGSIQVIVDDRVVLIPVDKVIFADNAVSTTLTKAEVGHLR